MTQVANSQGNPAVSALDNTRIKNEQMLHLPKSVSIVEVGPRDGLQSLPRKIDTDFKVAMVDHLTEAGFPVIEVTSFAHPRTVPNLADAEDVMARIQRRSGTIYRVLVPNARGAERAVASRPDEILGLTTVSASYLKKNQNMTRDEAVAQAVQAFRIAKENGCRFVMALGMALWCPYEGRIPESKVMDLLQEFVDEGMEQFYLAGSIGMEDPAHVNTLFHMVQDRFPQVEIGFHVHNISGMGTANVLAALDGGATRIEGSICGIGGGIATPRGMGSSGNLASEDIVHMLNEMGVDTGMDLPGVLVAARKIAALLRVESQSYISRSGTRADITELEGASQVAGPETKEQTT